MTDIPTHRAMSLKQIINLSGKTKKNNKKTKNKKTWLKVNFVGRLDGMWLKIYMAKNIRMIEINEFPHLTASYTRLVWVVLKDPDSDISEHW